MEMVVVVAVVVAGDRSGGEEEELRLMGFRKRELIVLERECW
ncbi:hypothetical protein Hanom_Chr02g00171291 [Helianthus anomalus]